MHYSQIIFYKGFIITRNRRDGYYDALTAEHSGFEYAFNASDYEDCIDWIDHKLDGREPEGYFQKY